MLPGAGRYVDGSGTHSSLARGYVRNRRAPPRRTAGHPREGCPSVDVATCGHPGCVCGQASEMVVPETVIGFAASGAGAGPPVTEPSAAENLLPWQGQLIGPLATLLTGQP